MSETASPKEGASKRVNARLEEARARKLEYVLRHTNWAVSEVLKRGIDLVYQEVRGGGNSPYEILDRSGFIASGSAQEDLSERYKEELAELLEAKHGHR